MEVEQVLLEGQVTYSKEILEEFVRALFKTAIFLCYLLTPALILVGILDYIESGDSFIIAICFGIGFILPMLIYLNYDKQVKLSYARCLEQNNGKELLTEIRFFNDKVFLQNPQYQQSYPYSVIRRIMESKNLIMLTTAAKVMIIVEKSTLKYGSKDELLAFVKSKIQSK